MKEQISVLFRCDGSVRVGMGHVMRCLVLAEELLHQYGCKVTFAVREGPIGIQKLQQQGFPVLTAKSNGAPFDYSRWLEEAIETVRAQVLVLDARDGPPLSALEKTRTQGTLLATIDDPTSSRLAADLAFCMLPMPEGERLDWSGFSGRRLAGWQWAIVGPQFLQHRPRPDHDGTVVLVTMGGSDPAGLTLKAIKALDLLNEDFTTWVVLGPGFAQCRELEDCLAGTKRQYRLLKDVGNMAEIMAQVDFAVASFGGTAYELAVLGVPALYLCLSQDHAQSASAFVEAGMASSLGVHTQVSEAALASAVSDLLGDKTTRKRMTQRARQRLDGLGARRIAREIVTQAQRT